MGNKELKNKVVIVTGANHGIGQAISIAFAKEGAKVFINYYRAAAEGYGVITSEQANNATEPGRAYYYKMQTKTADDTIEAINKLGGRCFALEADLSEPENIPMLFDKAENEFGQVDIVVNNAAYCKLDTFIPSFELEKKKRGRKTAPSLHQQAGLFSSNFLICFQALKVIP